jgi:hypothetical protein
MPKQRFFTDKEKRVRPIADSRPSYRSYQKGTASLGIPKKFNSQKIALQKAEKLKEAEKQKTDLKNNNSKEVKNDKEIQQGNLPKKQNEVSKSSEVQKPIQQPKAAPKVDTSPLSDAWFDSKISPQKPKPTPQPNTQQTQQKVEGTT